MSVRHDNVCGMQGNLICVRSRSIILSGAKNLLTGLYATCGGIGFALKGQVRYEILRYALNDELLKAPTQSRATDTTTCDSNNQNKAGRT